MQFEKNVVEQFLWESYNIDSRKHLYKIINEADDDTRKEIGKHRILQDYFLLRRGRDPGFAVHVYKMIKKDTKSFKSTAFYIQKLLLDGSYYNESQIFSPCISNQNKGQKRLNVDSDLKHTYHIPINFEERGDGYFNIKHDNSIEYFQQRQRESTDESLQYFKQRYEIALENKDDLTADATRDLSQEYRISSYSFDYFTKKQNFYWNSSTAKKENFDFRRYISKSIVNHHLYGKNCFNSEIELAMSVLSLGLEDDFLKLLFKYDVDINTKLPEDKFSPLYIKFLMDVFSIVSTIWFNSLSLKEKEQLLNRVYPFDKEILADYFSCLDNTKNTSFLLKDLAFNMYSNQFYDVAESIYAYLNTNTKGNYEKASYFGKRGDVYREKIEYEKAYAMYKQSFDLSSKIPLKNRRVNKKSLDFHDTPRYLSTIMLLRMAEMELLLKKEDAEEHLEEARKRIERTKRLEKISLMWNLACTYRRTGQFDKEYDCLDYLTSIGEGKRNDLVEKADERLIQINEYVLESGHLDENKLNEEEENKKLDKLISIAETLKNSFQFERESEYLNTALKIKDNDGVRFNFSISTYNGGYLDEARINFEKLIDSSEKDITIKSHVYLALISFQQNNDQKGFEEISFAFMPPIVTLSAFNLTEHDDAELKQDFNQQTIDNLTELVTAKAMESLQPSIELCVTNLLFLKKDKILKHILDDILDLSAQMCSPNVHHAFVYIATQILLSKGLTDEALHYSKKSIEQFSNDEAHKIAAMDTTAHIYFELGQHDRSIKYLKGALRIDSQHPNMWKNLGLNYEQLLDFKNAEESIERALEIKPEYPGLEKLKEKYNRLKKDTINFNDIKDDDVKKFFMSAERLVMEISDSVNEDEFDFTMALVSYGKGLESLVHKEVSKPLRNKIHKKYGRISDKLFKQLPSSLKHILGEKERTITLGSWQYIINDCKKNISNPIVKESRDHFEGKLNKNKNIIFDSCKTVSDYRNGSAHYTSKTMDEIIKDRKIIVEHVNNVINAFYS